MCARVFGRPGSAPRPHPAKALLLASLAAAALLPASQPVCAVRAPWPATRVTPGRTASDPVVGAVPPGSMGCPATPVGLVLRTDASGYGTVGLPDGPVLLPSAGAVAFLTVTRRPIPRVTSVTARTFSGRTLWVHPLAPGMDPSNVTAFGGALAVALHHGGTAIVVLLSPRTGRTLTSTAVPWPAGSLGPYLTAAGSHTLLITGAPVDLPAALGGLGSGSPDAWALTAHLHVVWHRQAVGRLLALAPGVAVLGSLTGPRSNVVVLHTLDLGTGRTRWVRRVVLPTAPTTASFVAVAAAHALITAFTWPGGGRLSSLDLSHGSTRWARPTRRAVWIAAGSLLVGGVPPWQPVRPLAVRSLTDGQAAPSPPLSGFPVASFGTWLLVATPRLPVESVGGAPSPWVLRLVAPATLAKTSGSAASLGGPAPPAGAPPYTIVCTPQTAYVFTPWVAGSMAELRLAGEQAP